MKARDKRFLNDSHSEWGYVGWSVDNETYAKSYLTEGSLTIADCNHAINLDFDCDTRKHLDKRIAKLDNLIESLQEMRKSLVKVGELHDKSKKFHY